MTVVYEYTKSGDPCVVMIKDLFSKSGISANVLKIFDADRTVDPDTSLCTSCSFKIEISEELSGEDKTTLDGIVDSSINMAVFGKSPQIVFKELFDSCADDSQRMRFLAALDNHPSFDRAIAQRDFALAHLIKNAAYAAEELTEADVALIDSVIPTSKWIPCGE